MENIHREIQTKVKAHINAVAPDIVKGQWLLDNDGRNPNDAKTFRTEKGLNSFIEDVMWGGKENFGKSKVNAGDGAGYDGASAQGQ